MNANRASVLGASVYVPAISDVQNEFKVSPTLAILGLSLYTFGLVFGSTLGGPLSELFGRRIIYLISLPILMGFSIAAAEAGNIGVLLVSRLLAGAGGSLCISTGGGTMTDLWDMRQTSGTPMVELLNLVSKHW